MHELVVLRLNSNRKRSKTLCLVVLLCAAIYFYLKRNSLRMQKNEGIVPSTSYKDDLYEYNATILDEDELQSSLKWIAPCVYEIKNFCVVPGADVGIALFTKSGKIEKALSEIKGFTQMGIMLCSEASIGFLNAHISTTEVKNLKLFEKFVSNNSAHIFNSVALSNPSHLLYSFPSAYEVSQGSSNYDVYVTLGGSRRKNHIHSGDLTDFLSSSKSKVRSTFVKQVSAPYSRSLAGFFGTVFPNFYIKDTLSWGSIKCYRKGVIGKKIALSGTSFLPPFVSLSSDRDEQLRVLKRKMKFPFPLAFLQNTLDQKSAQTYRVAVLDKLQINQESSDSINLLFALRYKDRNITNISNLIEIAQGYDELNVKAVYMEDLSIVQQIEHGFSADIILGPEGSNLWITFWQRQLKVLIMLQNPSACIARCEWRDNISNGDHDLYYASNPAGVWSRIAWWANVYSFVLDTKKCDPSLSLRKEEERTLAFRVGAQSRAISYEVNENNFRKILSIAVTKLHTSKINI